MVKLYMPPIPRSQRCCLVLIKNFMGGIQTELIPFPPDGSPAAFMQEVRRFYEGRVTNAQQRFYRYALMRKPEIRIVKVHEQSALPNATHNASAYMIGLGGPLTEALKNPETTPFLHDENIFLTAGQDKNRPIHAIMIVFEASTNSGTSGFGLSDILSMFV